MTPTDIIANELRYQSGAFTYGGFGKQAELIVRTLANHGYDVVLRATASDNPSDTDDPFGDPNEDIDALIVAHLPEKLRERTCPAGLPHTGDDPASDHGHTDCWIMQLAATEIERLRAERDAAVAQAVTAEAEVQRLRDAIGDQDVDQCAICADPYCSGAYCLERMVAELPEEHQNLGESIEKLQDMVRLGRILAEWAAVSPATPTPTTCPTCGSETSMTCSDPFHRRQIPDPWHTGNDR